MVVKERLDIQPLALPAELRHTIYEMALGPDTYPHHVILSDWSGVDLGVISTPKLLELHER